MFQTEKPKKSTSLKKKKLDVTRSIRICIADARGLLVFRLFLNGYGSSSRKSCRPKENKTQDSLPTLPKVSSSIQKLPIKRTIR